jgi:acid phosphatase
MARASASDPLGALTRVVAAGLPGPDGSVKPFLEALFGGRYAKRHMPFLYFRDVLASRRRLRQVVPLSQFSRDLASAKLPSFSLVVPDVCHDMHDCKVSTGDAWLRGFLTPLLRNQALANSAVFVITDEPANRDATARVPALALGPLVKARSRFATRTSHYGLLRTIEDAWGLTRLGRSARVAPITGIWK